MLEGGSEGRGWRRRRGVAEMIEGGVEGESWWNSISWLNYMTLLQEKKEKEDFFI